MDIKNLSIHAVSAIGAALVVLFIGAGVILGVGHSVPTEFWAAASSLSGALVGLLAPQPATKGALQRQATQLHALAATAPDDQRTAFTARAEQTSAAVTGSSTFDLRIVLLSVVGFAAFVTGIVLAFQVGDHVAAATTAYDTAIKNAADTLIALGSGAAGAVIGLLAPTPGAAG
ncbi:hypothetical protein [Jatrophihabitans sp.]|uniref:hypothetical protein n=1 Tax=Jatrophihabitans sp. TaxID=1932789 RepID=UPI0030C744F3|nr:hypothetical protein [Jatrophihabitans sp.]